jgi:hypothetical protein
MPPPTPSAASMASPCTIRSTTPIGSGPCASTTGCAIHCRHEALRLLGDVPDPRPVGASLPQRLPGVEAARTSSKSTTPFPTARSGTSTRSHERPRWLGSFLGFVATRRYKPTARPCGLCASTGPFRLAERSAFRGSIPARPVAGITRRPGGRCEPVQTPASPGKRASAPASRPRPLRTNCSRPRQH